MQSSCFPDIWKVSRVCPIFKKGDKIAIENYRAVSVLNTFSKVFEKIICKRILNAVGNNISPYQHGFMNKRSTCTNLAYFTEYTSKALQSNKPVDTVYFDFKSAFDSVQHSTLILKLLTNFDIPDYLLLLLRSYLSQRNQNVVVNGV